MTDNFVLLAVIFAAITFSAWVGLSIGISAWQKYRHNFTRHAQDNLSRMFLFIDARKVFIYNLAAITIVPLAVYLVTRLPVFAVVAGATMWGVPKVLFRIMHRRRLVRFEAQLPEGLNMMAGAMRAGASLPLAIEAMVREVQAPLSQEFGLVLREQRMGIPLDEAFENLGKRVPSADLGLVVAAARIARDVGGNLSEVFNRLADTLRQKAVMEGKIKALTSQGKLQGWIVGLLPIAMIFVLYQMEPNAMLPLFVSVLGWAVLGVIAILEILGALMIRKIVTIDV